MPVKEAAGKGAWPSNAQEVRDDITCVQFAPKSRSGTDQRTLIRPVPLNFVIPDSRPLLLLTFVKRMLHPGKSGTRVRSDILKDLIWHFALTLPWSAR